MKTTLKKYLPGWFLVWMYSSRHLFRILLERWWYDRQELMDGAHILKEWDFESPVEQARYGRVLDAVSRLYPVKNGVHALEMGCSEGVFTQRLAALCASVTAYDISPIARANAARRCACLPNVKIQSFDLESDSIARKYDWVVAMDILEYVHGRDRLGRVIEKLTHALKKDGLLVVSVCRLPEDLRGAWWVRWIPEGADAVIKFMNGRSGLRLVYREFYPEEERQISGYPQHIVALFRISA